MVTEPQPTARIDPQTWIEIRRKSTHMLPGAIPFIMWFVYHEDPLPLWNLGVVAAAVTALILIAVRTAHGGRRHDGEDWGRTCMTYGIPPFLTLLAFPAQAEYAAVVLTVLAFGDPAAAIAGRLIGRWRLPWNREKSWAGLMAFVLLAVPMATLAYWGEAHPRVTWTAALACGSAAGITAAAAESLAVRIDDNLRVSFTAAVAVVTTSQLIVET